jgi:hypothetical protein
MNSILEDIKKRNEDEIYIKPLNLAARTLVFSTETFFDKTFFKPNKKFFDVQKMAAVREQIGKEVTAAHNGIVYKYELRRVKRRKTIPLQELRASRTSTFSPQAPFNEIKHFYKILPWVKDDINDIYIRPINSEAESLVIREHSLTDTKGRKYYKPNKRYFEIQTNSTKKRQIKEEFSAVYEDTIFKFSVGIITNRGLIVQNEDIFRAETEFINAWRSSDRSQEIKVILDAPVGDAIRYSSKQLVSAALKSRSEARYVCDIVSVFEQHFGANTDTFMSHLLDLVVFIEPQLSFLRETTFSRRMRSDEPFYKPNILPFLTPAEKLEEIYADPKLPANTLDYVNNHIVEKKATMKESWIQTIVMTQNLGMKRDRRKMAPHPKNKPKIVDLPPWKSVCKNSMYIENEADENLIFYREDVDVYGFTIENMFKIIETTGVNPFTKNPIPHDYVQRFLDTFHPVREKPREQRVVIDSEEIVKNNLLAELLDSQLAVLEKVCFVCRKGPTLKEYEIFRGNDTLCFCSQECFKKNRSPSVDVAFEDVPPQQSESNNFSMFF